MKRTTLLAACTAGAVLLAGCSSTSGTASPASTSPSVVSSPTVSSVAVVPTSSAPSSDSAQVSDSFGSTPESSAPESSAPDSSAPDSSAPDSTSAESSDVDTGAPSSSSPATTVGGTGSDLDAASSAWFSAFCGGFTPVLTLAKQAQSVGSSASDPTKGQKLIVDLYKGLGTAFTGTAAKLKKLPPPTFSGGDAFATKVEGALGSAGPEFTKAGTTLAKIDVAKDPSAFASAVGGLTTSLKTALQPLEDLDSLKLTPQTQAAFEKLPACAKLETVATG